MNSQDPQRSADLPLSIDVDLPRSPTAPGRLPATAHLVPRTQVFLMQAPGGAPAAAGAEVNDAVDRAGSGGGQPLPVDLRGRFETSLGTDLSAVRIHTGSDSVRAARSLQARAYTTGNDIHFNDGQYRPSDPFGVHLLAHEVAHTVQQGGAPSSPQTKLEVSAPGDACEVEADRAADAMVAGAGAVVTRAAGLARKVIQRQGEGGAPQGDGAGGASGVPADGASGTGGAPQSTPAQTNGGAPGAPPAAGPATRGIPEADPGPTFIVPFDWDAAAVGVSASIDVAWGGVPNFNQVRSPKAAGGISAFSGVWEQVRGTWNAIPPLSEPYDAACKSAEAALPATGIPKPLDPKTAGPAYAMVQNKTLALRNAGVTAAQKSRAIALPMRDAETALRSAQNEARNVSIAIEESKIADAANQIAQLNNIKDGMSKALGGISAVGAAIVDPGKAIDAVAKVGDFVAAGIINTQIHGLTTTVAAAIQHIASLKVANAAANMQSFMATAQNKLDEAINAVGEYDKALTDRQGIQLEIASLMQQAAAQSGRAGDAADMRTALAAVPFVETVVAQNRALAARIALPGYTEESGIGATLSTNRGDFCQHLGVLKGYRAKVEADRPHWEQTLSQLNSLTPAIPGIPR